MGFQYAPFPDFTPKQQMRFIMYVDREGINIPTYMVRTMDKPNLDQNPVTVDYINTDFKIKGKSRWQNITINCYDPIEINGALLIYKWVNNIHHNSETGVDGMPKDYKKDIVFESVFPDGRPAEICKLYGAFIADVNWGNYDLTSDDLVIPEITLSYDYAVTKVPPTMPDRVPLFN